MSPLPTTTLARLPKHIARLNSCVARLRAAGHAVTMVVRNGEVAVSVDGDAPALAVAKAVVAAAERPPEPQPEPKPAPSRRQAPRARRARSAPPVRPVLNGN